MKDPPEKLPSTSLLAGLGLAPSAPSATAKKERPATSEQAICPAAAAVPQKKLWTVQVSRVRVGARCKLQRKRTSPCEPHIDLGRCFQQYDKLFASFTSCAVVPMTICSSCGCRASHSFTSLLTLCSWMYLYRMVGDTVHSTSWFPFCRNHAPAIACGYIYMPSSFTSCASCPRSSKCPCFFVVAQMYVHADNIGSHRFTVLRIRRAAGRSRVARSLPDPNLMLVSDLKGRLLYVSTAMAQILGTTPKVLTANDTKGALEGLIVQPFAQLHRTLAASVPPYAPPPYGGLLVFWCLSDSHPAVMPAPHAHSYASQHADVQAGTHQLSVCPHAAYSKPAVSLADDGHLYLLHTWQAAGPGCPCYLPSMGPWVLRWCPWVCRSRPGSRCVTSGHTFMPYLHSLVPLHCCGAALFAFYALALLSSVWPMHVRGSHRGLLALYGIIHGTPFSLFCVR